MNDLFEYILFTDGSCQTNPGPGGWAFVLTTPQKEVISEYGYEERSTNNRMEMKAALEGLRRTPKGAKVTLNSDSSYVLNGIDKWLANWRRKGFKRNNKLIPNDDLWRELDRELAVRTVKCVHVRGHQGNNLNEMCDMLARRAVKEGRNKSATGENMSDLAQKILSLTFAEEDDRAKLLSAMREAIAFLEGGQ
ncbi:MAG: ribonuclease H [Planctomycetota bacterium]|nr:ribonuclease H [Planctomycetota bacterium]